MHRKKCELLLWTASAVIMDNDPEKSGIHMLEMLAKFRNEGVFLYAAYFESRYFRYFCFSAMFQQHKRLIINILGAQHILAGERIANRQAGAGN